MKTKRLKMMYGAFALLSLVGCANKEAPSITVVPDQPAVTERTMEREQEHSNVVVTSVTKQENTVDVNPMVTKSNKNEVVQKVTTTSRPTVHVVINGSNDSIMDSQEESMGQGTVIGN